MRHVLLVLVAASLAGSVFPLIAQAPAPPLGTARSIAAGGEPTHAAVQTHKVDRIERYTLVQVNGRPLPFRVYAVEDDCEAHLIAGTLDLEPVGRRYVVVDRVREGCAWSAPQEAEEQDRGLYYVDAPEMRFRSDWKQVPSWLGRSKRDGTIEIVRGARAYTYRRYHETVEP